MANNELNTLIAALTANDDKDTLAQILHDRYQSLIEQGEQMQAATITQQVTGGLSVGLALLIAATNPYGWIAAGVYGSLGLMVYAAGTATEASLTGSVRPVPGVAYKLSGMMQSAQAIDRYQAIASNTPLGCDYLHSSHLTGYSYLDATDKAEAALLHHWYPLIAGVLSKVPRNQRSAFYRTAINTTSAKYGRLIRTQPESIAALLETADIYTLLTPKAATLEEIAQPVNPFKAQAPAVQAPTGGLRAIMAQSATAPPSAKPDPAAIKKAMGDYMFKGLSQSKKAEIIAIAKQSAQSALEAMLAYYGYTNSEIENQWPGGLEALGRSKPQLPTTAIQPQLAASTSIEQQATQLQIPQLQSYSEASGELIEMDLVAQMLALSQFCHVLLAGENGTGKTTFAIVLLKQIMQRFATAPDFDMLIIDPKMSQWGGLYKSRYYQPAFPDSISQLEKSVDRLEAFYNRLRLRAERRQQTGERAETPLLVIIDEVNTWLDSLQMMDRRIAEGNKGLSPAEKTPALQLNSRAKSAILGIARMGREDRIWLWMIGQNPNLEPLGLSGASDRANFTVVAVGCGDNQIGIELALSNQTMFPNGQKLRPLLEANQGGNYQLAACSRYPKNLLRMPANYPEISKGDIPAPAATPETVQNPIALSPTPQPIAAKPDDDPWQNSASQAIDDPQETLNKLAAVAGVSPVEMQNLLKALSNAKA